MTELRDLKDLTIHDVRLHHTHTPSFQMESIIELGFPPDRLRANMAHMRQSRPDFVLGFQVKVLKPIDVSPSALGSKSPDWRPSTQPWCRATAEEREYVLNL